MLAREREPGSRSDHYRIYDEDVCGMIFTLRAPAPQVYEAAADGAKLLKPGPGARRMRETQEFYAFLRTEMAGLLARWREHRRTVLADYDATYEVTRASGI